MPGELGTSRPLRAGDRDRAAVVDLLRAHHLDGRLTVEEFEERVELAQHAVTLIELAELHDDLPELPPRRGKVVARRRRAPRIPGRYAFVERVALEVDPKLARDEAFEHIAPALARHGYELKVAGSALMFRRRSRPAWTILLAIFTFPIGPARAPLRAGGRGHRRSSRTATAARRCSRTASGR